MKEVLFITTNEHCAWGGSEQLWFETAKVLLESGTAVTVLTKHWSSEPAHLKELTACGAKILYPEKSFLHDVMAFSASRLFPPRPHSGAKRRIACTLQTHPDLCVISQATSFEGLGGMLFCQEQRIPYVTISHIAKSCCRHREGFRKELQQGFSQALCNFVVSHATQHELQEQIEMPLPRAQIVYNPYALDYDFTCPFPAESDELRLATMARLEVADKGQDLLCEVLKEKKWRRRQLTVSLYGKGADKQMLEERIKKYDLDSLKLMGYSSPSAVWPNYHGFILPSRYEGLPITLVEAQLAGRAGVLTDVGGSTEIVQARDMFIASSASVHALGDALEVLWQERKVLKQRGASARRFVRGRIPQKPAEVFTSQLQSVSEAQNLSVAV